MSGKTILKEKISPKRVQKPHSSFSILNIPRRFTRNGENPLDEVMYVKRSSVINNPDGSIVFQMKEVEVPEREVNVKSLKFLKLRKVSNKKLLENIEKRIKKVKGDFRQEEILKIWSKELTKDENFASVFPIVRFQVVCTSGTYVRGIAHNLGEKMDIPALAFSIKRIKIGKYDKV